MNEIAQPHDRLFKVLMSHPETAGAFLRESLPPEVSRLLVPEPPQRHVRQIVRRINPQKEAEMMSQFAQEILAKGKPEWAAMVRQEGKKEGEKEGEKKGERKGETAILTRLLQRRFGDLPPWVSDKIAQADLLTLEEWSLRVLDATTLESVLADPSPPGTDAPR